MCTVTLVQCNIVFLRKLSVKVINRILKQTGGLHTCVGKILSLISKGSNKPIFFSYFRKYDKIALNQRLLRLRNYSNIAKARVDGGGRKKALFIKKFSGYPKSALTNE